MHSVQPLPRLNEQPASDRWDGCVSVIVPVYNEVAHLEPLLKAVLASPVKKEIIIVDDGSTDGTCDKLRALPLRNDLTIVFHEKNCGKGASIRTALGYARGEYILIQDSDLEYDPRDYPKLLEPIVEGRADVVYGSRFLGGPQRVHYFWHYVANKALTLLSDIFTNLKLTDMETCYKVFRRDVLKDIQLKSNRFGFEPEITAKIAKGKWRIYEVPISYAGRTYEEGKKITWKDGVQALWCIIRFKFGD